MGGSGPGLSLMDRPSASDPGVLKGPQRSRSTRHRESRSRCAMGDRGIRRVPNGARASAAEEWVATALDESCHFTPDFLSKEGWLVVPVESASHFDEHDAERIARAATLLGQTKLRAVLLEHLREARDHLEVDATEQGLLLFDRECAHFNLALLPEDRSFAVICTTYDYYLVAGPRRFVEVATGKEVSEARSDFGRFARDDCWSAPDRERLVEVSQRYERE